MINNAYISFISGTGGGHDGDGNVLPPTEVISEYAECNLKTVKRDYGKYVEGLYVRASYTVYIDASAVSEIDTGAASRIQLQDSNNKDLGIFQVQDLEPLPLMRKLKVTV